MGGTLKNNYSIKSHPFPAIFLFQFLLNLYFIKSHESFIGNKRFKSSIRYGHLKNLPFVKAKNLSPYKAKVLEDIREAVEEMNLIKAGKLEARDAEELFREL